MYRSHLLIKGSLLALLTAGAGLEIHHKLARIHYLVWEHWGQLEMYREPDQALRGTHPDVVFFGDSIIKKWEDRVEFMTARRVVNRGMSGESSEEMSYRFDQDVINLHPSTVLILAGTNDIGERRAPYDERSTERHIREMAEEANRKGIRVILCSVPPAIQYPWRPQLRPAAEIEHLNVWLKSYAARKGFSYVDFWDPMSDAQGGMLADLSLDGVHPNAAGYAVMEGEISKVLPQTLSKNVAARK